MKTFAAVLTIAFISVNISFAQGPTVSLKFNAMCAGKPFVLNRVVKSINDDSYFSVSMLRYYITGVSIKHDGGQTYTIKESVHLVDEAEPRPFVLATFPVQNIEAIKFFIGVEEERNHLDPTTYPPFHPLAPQKPTMHWGWAAGYRFVTMEGKAGSNEMNATTDYQIHSLGDELYGSVEIPLNLSVTGENATIELNAEYGNLLRGIDVGQGPVSHSSDGISATLISNFLSSVYSPATTSGVEDETLDFVQVYPNPTTDQIIVSAHGFNGTAKLVDANGATVSTQTVSGTVHFQTTGLSNGTYSVIMQSNFGQTSSHRVVVSK